MVINKEFLDSLTLLLKQEDRAFNVWIEAARERCPMEEWVKHYTNYLVLHGAWQAMYRQFSAHNR